MYHINKMEFGSSQEAWQGINEYLANNEMKIMENGGGRYGPEMVSYNNWIFIERAYVDPNFDYGFVLGYRKQKWSSLVNNYVNLNLLDATKSQVLYREGRKSQSYNISFLFDNTHNSGKGCLLSLTFARKKGIPNPVLIFYLRSSEVTKRLIFDLLLVQRIGEYVYGTDKFFSLQMICPNMYISAEAFCMYDNVKKLDTVIKPVEGAKKLSTFQQRILDVHKHYSTVDPSTIKYRSSLRSVNQLQRDKNGHPLSGDVHLYAKNMQIHHESVYPIDIISPSVRKKYRAYLKKKDNETSE